MADGCHLVNRNIVITLQQFCQVGYDEIGAYSLLSF